MTLPLIHVMHNVSKNDRSWLINSIKNYNKDKKRVQEVIDFVIEHGGLEYAVDKMKEFQNKAFLILQNYPDSEFRKSLEIMVNYVIERKK